MSTDDVDRLLSDRGVRYQRWGQRGADDVDDLGRRAGRQHRKRQLAAVAVVLVVLGGVALRGLAGTSDQSVRVGDGGPGPPTTTEPDRSPAPVAPSTATAATASTVVEVSSTVAGVPATTPPPVVTSTSVPLAGGVHAMDWAKATYPREVCTSLSGEGSAFESLTFAGVVYGDVTGDGRDEAVVSFDCRTGGSLHWSTASLYTSDATAPTGVRRLTGINPFSAMVTPEGNAAIDARYFQSATFTAGALTTRWAVYTDTDPNNSPSKQATVTQHWNGTALVNDGAPTLTDAPT